MSDVEAKQIKPYDDELLEEWVRVTDEEDILGVDVTRLADDEWPWQVGIYVAEFIREEPLQSELHNAITNALNKVPGVVEAFHDDRETWIVRGNVTGDALVRAAGAALDQLAEALRAAYSAL